MNTPLLLIAWRRPHTLRQVIDAIRPVGPTRLYVACDGPNPNRPGEAEKVAATRAVIEYEIDWPCQVERLYSDVNQGCRTAVINAINWFYDREEEGIILEDDCIPHPDFFLYCTMLLGRYRDDTRVMSICGSNFQNGSQRGDGSYYFSIYPDPWGWATWRRAWSQYSKAEHIWPYIKQRRLLDRYFSSPAELDFWINTFDSFYHDGVIDKTVWCYQWYLLSFAEHAIHAWPNVPLVYNCGFGQDATHTFCANPCQAVSEIGEIIHPLLVAPDPIADAYAFESRFNGKYIKDVFRYGDLYPLIRRMQTARDQGYFSYVYKHFARLISL